MTGPIMTSEGGERWPGRVGGYRPMRLPSKPILSGRWCQGPRVPGRSLSSRPLSISGPLRGSNRGSTRAGGRYKRSRVIGGAPTGSGCGSPPEGWQALPREPVIPRQGTPAGGRYPPRRQRDALGPRSPPLAEGECGVRGPSLTVPGHQPRQPQSRGRSVGFDPRETRRPIAARDDTHRASDGSVTRSDPGHQSQRNCGRPGSGVTVPAINMGNTR